MSTIGTQADSRCLNCEQPLARNDRYCGICGQDNSRKRLTFRSTIHDTCEYALNLEWPLLRTAINLTWRPGWVASEYVRGKRRAFVNPMKYCLLLAALDVVLIKLFGIDFEATLGAPSEMAGDPAMERAYEGFRRILEFMMEWLAAFTVLTLPVLAGFMRLLTWRADRNFIEHYVLCLYVYGQSFLFQALLIPLGIYDSAIGTQLSNLLPFGIYALGAAQFVSGRRWVVAVKSIIAHLGYFIFFMGAYVAATFIYVIATSSAGSA